MKLFVHYDASGRIRSATWFDAPPNAGMMLVPRAGHLVAEVEDEKLVRDARSEKVLRALMKKQRVQTPAPPCTLAPASRAAKPKARKKR